jgi:hypothetical protein
MVRVFIFKGGIFIVKVGLIVADLPAVGKLISFPVFVSLNSKARISESQMKYLKEAQLTYQTFMTT